MKDANKYARLAELTGLPNLAKVSDPVRLERLVAAAESQYAHSTAECPLRIKAACKQYADAAQHRLEHPEAIQ